MSELESAVVEQIAPRTTLLDVEYQGRREVIAACLLEDASGAAIVDPGPSSSLCGLRARLAERGLSVADIHTLLLTHIHLDHAGATGTLVKENPRLQVYVHEKGARHMVDPTRLLESASRIYGAAMDRLWGEILAVPADNVHALAGGESLSVGGRQLEVAYTPGHASHHVTYFDEAEGIAFVGDTAGMRIGNKRCVVPVTPPPDIDLKSWQTSLERIRERRPQRLFVTHFGPADPVDWHLEDFRERLESWSGLTGQTLRSGGTDPERASRFAEQAFSELIERLPAEEIRRFLHTGSLETSWYGLARYWRKRGG